MKVLSFKAIKRALIILTASILLTLVFSKNSLSIVYAVENNKTDIDSKEYQEKLSEIVTIPEETTALAIDESQVLPELTPPISKPNAMDRSFSSNTLKITEDLLSKNIRSTNQNTDPNYAYLITNDTITQGICENTSEFRWYAFILNGKSKSTILLQAESQLDADLYMFKFNDQTSNLELIGGSTNEGRGVSEYYTDVLDAGIYYFAIAGYEGTGKFAFAYYESMSDVNMEINDSIENATNVSLSMDVVGIIDNPFDRDYYAFTVSKPTLLRYTISTVDEYLFEYAGSSGTSTAPIIVDGNMIKVTPGTYYFAVLSSSDKYSMSSTYTINFKRVGEYAKENIVPLRAICEEAQVVFQTNVAGTLYYVNGNPIDISYSYNYNDSNSGGSESYSITLEDNIGVRCQNYKEEMQSPRVTFYHNSTMPNTKVESKPLLELLFFGDESNKFYKIHCKGTGAYTNNSLWIEPNYVIVLIDPDTGKLVDIAEYNYFYQWAYGSNYLSTSHPYTMTFNYSLYDYVN